MMLLNNLVTNSAKGKKKKQVEQSKQTCDLQQKLSRWSIFKESLNSQTSEKFIPLSALYPSLFCFNKIDVITPCNSSLGSFKTVLEACKHDAR